VLVLAHLLSDEVARRPRKLAHYREHPMQMVVGEPTLPHPVAPWRRRSRAYAAGVGCWTKNTP
jgi:hypothetical protein